MEVARLAQGHAAKWLLSTTPRSSDSRARPGAFYIHGNNLLDQANLTCGSL